LWFTNRISRQHHSPRLVVFVEFFFLEKCKNPLASHGGFPKPTWKWFLCGLLQSPAASFISFHIPAFRKAIKLWASNIALFFGSQLRSNLVSLFFSSLFWLFGTNH
jgi:hypothetical protein